MYYYQDDERNMDCPQYERSHVHELVGSTVVANSPCRHAHRFSNTTGKSIRVGNNDHVHDVRFSTDTFEGHNHEYCGRTSREIRVGDRHVHFLKAITNMENGHRHEFRAVTLLNDSASE